jgi:hypothetical protein
MSKTNLALRQMSVHDGEFHSRGPTLAGGINLQDSTFAVSGNNKGIL